MTALALDAPWAINQGIPEHLPLMDEFVREMGTTIGWQIPKNIVLIQHQLGSMIPLLSALFALGANPSETHWIDIPYSSNRTVRKAARGLGIPERNLPASDFDPTQDYVNYQSLRVGNLLQQAAALAGGGPLLVLDDGAHALRASLQTGLRIQDLRVVEQTAHGVEAIREDAALSALAQTVSVVNVAESIPKKTLEPPWIARSVRLAVEGRLRRYGCSLRESRTLILGCGAIGQALIEELLATGMKRDNLCVVDPRPQCLTSARSRGLAAACDTNGLLEYSNHGGFAIIIGCSGYSSFSVEDCAVLSEPALLVSASSGQHEFPIRDFVDRGMLVCPSDVPKVHDDLDFVAADGRKFSVANGGFPVNFDGRIENVPEEHIQFTRVAMLAASMQAAASPNVGVIGLSEKFAHWIMERRVSTSSG